MQLSDYHKKLEHIEQLISNNGVKSEDIQQYRKLSIKMEDFIAAQGNDERHHIMLIIPVADRPQHLENCLESIYNLCENFYYGGKEQDFNKVSVLVAEDSKKISCRDKNRKIIESFCQRGLRTVYFGLDEQKEILASLSCATRKALYGIVGNISSDDFSHKGASITRNITYLKLNQIKDNYKNIIFYFIDSDQEFKVNPVLEDGHVVPYTLNYFYHLDKIFSDNDIDVFTGKVVGDPPVSPSVMAANFLDDVCSFLASVSACDLDGACCFHGNRPHGKTKDAAYHDMADLFGFKIKPETFNYSCDMELPHSNKACLERFSHQLSQFFDGVHLTRKNYYQHENIAASITAARTVYTGNFAFTQSALRYFIPFANLKFRMAGPTMGRLIKDQLGNRFVSANLPMLHERTVEHMGKSEFRSGIQHNEDSINLQGEFERQYFGDVMLFSIEELLKSGYPEKNLSRGDISKVVLNKSVFLSKSYLEKLQQVQNNINNLKSIYRNKFHNTGSTINNIKHFIANMELNFSANSFSYQLVTKDNSKSPHLKSIIEGIMNYRKEVVVWSKLFEK